MDILHLVDRLEELFNESKPIWFTRSVIVDEDRLLDLIDQMRITIPDEIKKAQQLLSQRDRVLAQAQEESNRTIALAREKSEKLVDKDPTTLAAQVKAEQIIAQARLESDQTRHDADEYVVQTLLALQSELEKSLNQVKNGIIALQTEKKKMPTSSPTPVVTENKNPAMQFAGFFYKLFGLYLFFESSFWSSSRCF